jgi:predicted  nucleic acid-binding Zn-ribbon protein
MQEQIEAIERLAAIDAELEDLSGELEREREALSAKKEQLEQLEEKLSRDRESVVEMDRLRSDLVQEVRQMSLQLDKSREKLSRCRTEREANAAQREVEELRKLYRDREDEIGKLVTLGEQARSEIDSVSTKRDELASELGASEGDVTNRLGEAESQVQAKQAERADAVARLSKLNTSLYRRYELVRRRRGTAVAYSTDGSCGTCHVRMPPMQFQRLMRREEFGQCPNCSRILYYREEDPEDPDQESESHSADSPAGP